MKHIILILTFSLITLSVYSQLEYSKGFNAGYKEGYCYNDYGCITPISPITPIPHIGESNDSYQDGYNRGFKDGMESKKASTLQNNSSNTSTQSRYYRPVQQKYVSQFVPENLELMQDALLRTQAKHDNNVKYIGSLQDWIYSLRKENIDEELKNSLGNKLIALEKFKNDCLACSDVIKKLNEIEPAIKKDIENYNTRLKNKPAELYKKGNESMKSGNLSDAIKYFTEFLEMQPNYGPGYFLRGASFMSEKKYLSAINDFNKALNTINNDDKLSEQIYLYRASSFFETEQYTKAMSDCNKTLEFNSKNIDVYLLRGRIKSNLGDYYGSIKDNNTVIELNPNYSMAYNNRGWDNFELKKYKQALIDINKAIDLDEKNWVAYDSRQQTKFMLKNYKGCIKDADKAISLNPQCNNSWLFKGRSYYRIGNKEQACESWSKAGELGNEKAYEFISKYCNK